MFGVIKRLFKAKVEATKQQIDDWNDPDEENKSMPCDEIVIEGVDQDLHEKLMGQAVSAAAAFDGDQATLHGIQFSWTWDQTSGTLRIQAVKHPFYLTCSDIESKIRQLVANAKEESI